MDVIGSKVAVVDGTRPPAELATFAQSESPAWAAHASMGPKLAFADWGDEVMSLNASLEWQLKKHTSLETL